MRIYLASLVCHSLILPASPPLSASHHLLYFHFHPPSSLFFSFYSSYRPHHTCMRPYRHVMSCHAMPSKWYVNTKYFLFILRCAALRCAALHCTGLNNFCPLFIVSPVWSDTRPDQTSAYPEERMMFQSLIRTTTFLLHYLGEVLYHGAVD